MNIFFCRW